MKQVNVNRGDSAAFIQRFKVCERWKQYFEGLPIVRREGNAVIMSKPV